MQAGDKPQAVLFDLDGTLLLDSGSPADQFIVFCERLGHHFDAEAPLRLERWQHEYWSKREQVQADLAEHGQDNFWLCYNNYQLEFLGIQGPLHDYSLRIDLWFHEEYAYTPVVPDDVRPTLIHLRDSGITLGLVSNRAAALDTITAEHGLADLFNFTLSAGEAASWKPHPDIFHQALQRAGAAPETAVYVGDNYYADILGARRVGLTPILVDRRGVFPEADCRVIKEIGELQKL